jgi:predicted nucleic acid-binding protein
MKILVDTNVLMDYIANREPYAEQADKIMDLCISKEVDGCIAAHTVTNLFFILRKDLSETERRATLTDLCHVFTVVGIDAGKLLSALENNQFSDLEDCLQSECADEFEADYIITRNMGDFKHSKIKPIEPENFLRL